MIKMILSVEGMSCNMCEVHINQLIREKFPVKKVLSSHRKGKVEIIAESEIREEILQQFLGSIGYTLIAMHTEDFQKKRFLFF